MHVHVAFVSEEVINGHATCVEESVRLGSTASLAAVCSRVQRVQMQCEVPKPVCRDAAGCFINLSSVSTFSTFSYGVFAA